MKKLAFLGAAAGLGLGALLIAHTGHAADHLDAPAAAGNPLADITDVFAWMNSMGSKVNLVMDVSPADDGSPGRDFSPAVQYVFHVLSHTGATAGSAYAGAITGTGSATETKVICTFASPTSIQCWVVGANNTVKDYVTGDPSNTAGLTSADGKVKVFAGPRSDPFFFNIDGFTDAVAAVDAAEGSGGSGLDLLKDAAGCPNLSTAATAGVPEQLRAYLTEATGSGAGMHLCAGGDCFAALNVKAIVLQIDKTLLNDGSNIVLSVWASTHAGS